MIWCVGLAQLLMWWIALSYLYHCWALSNTIYPMYSNWSSMWCKRWLNFVYLLLGGYRSPELTLIRWKKNHLCCRLYRLSSLFSSSFRVYHRSRLVPYLFIPRGWVIFPILVYSLYCWWSPLYSVWYILFFRWTSLYYLMIHDHTCIPLHH